MSGYEMMSPAELVARVSPGLCLEDIATEDAAAIDHALRNHTQTVWALEDALEQKIRGILAKYDQPVRFRGVVYTISAGRLMLLR